MTLTVVAPIKHDVFVKKLKIARESKNNPELKGRLRIIAKIGKAEYIDLCYLDESCRSYGIPYIFSKPQEVDVEIKCLGQIMKLVED